MPNCAQLRQSRRIAANLLPLGTALVRRPAPRNSISKFLTLPLKWIPSSFNWVWERSRSSVCVWLEIASVFPSGPGSSTDGSIPRSSTEDKNAAVSVGWCDNAAVSVGWCDKPHKHLSHGNPTETAASQLKGHLGPSLFWCLSFHVSCSRQPDSLSLKESLATYHFADWQAVSCSRSVASRASWRAALLLLVVSFPHECFCCPLFQNVRLLLRQLLPQRPVFISRSHHLHQKFLLVLFHVLLHVLLALVF